MPARSRGLAPLDTSRPGLFPDTPAGFGRDYALPLRTRRAFSRASTDWVSRRDTLPAPIATTVALRPPG